MDVVRDLLILMSLWDGCHEGPTDLGVSVGWMSEGPTDLGVSVGRMSRGTY